MAENPALGEAPVFTAVPARPFRAQGGQGLTGVVVIHEGMGITPQLLRIGERLASVGYVVAAPDLFWRTGGSGARPAPEHMAALTDDEVRDDLAAAQRRLEELGASRFGITGFCMGGRLSYAASTWDLGFHAAVPFYGGGIASRLGEPRCPLLLFFGGRDEYISPEDIEAIRRHHPDETVVYPDAEHGFMRDGSSNHHPEASADAWQRLLQFLAQHLGAEPAGN